MRNKEIDHLLPIFLMSTRGKNGEEYEPEAISSFQRRIAQNEKKRRIVIDSDEDD